MTSQWRSETTRNQWHYERRKSQWLLLFPLLWLIISNYFFLENNSMSGLVSKATIWCVPSVRARGWKWRRSVPRDPESSAVDSVFCADHRHTGGNCSGTSLVPSPHVRCRSGVWSTRNCCTWQNHINTFSFILSVNLNIVICFSNAYWNLEYFMPVSLPLTLQGKGVLKFLLCSVYSKYILWLIQTITTSTVSVFQEQRAGFSY